MEVSFGRSGIRLSLTRPADWICADSNSALNWTANVENGFTFLQMEYVNPVPFQESQDLPRDGILYYAAKNVSTYHLCSKYGHLTSIFVD